MWNVWGRRDAYRVVVGKIEGKIPLGRQGRRWKYNIEMDLKIMGWERVDWIDLAQDTENWRAFVKAVMKVCFVDIFKQIFCVCF
jgi:hypothetical protein